MATNERALYRSEDWQEKNKPFFVVGDQVEATEWNEKKWGIFWTVNIFDGERKQENLKQILSWAVDFDTGTKESQRRRISSLGLLPSMVVEVKRGYHVYFDAIDATAENYNKILTGLCTLLDADQNAKGLNRVLRVPFYYHWKDPNDPYLVTVSCVNNISYTEDEMLKFVVKNELKKNEHINKPRHKNKSSLDTFFDRVSNINCEQALLRLSGSNYVSGETYEMRRQGNGKSAVLVNGKSANVWIDQNGKIGSSDHGGPTIYQWLKWFGHSHEVIKTCLEENFPEVLR